MEFALDSVQIVVALGILNVWIVRFARRSSWRGGEAKNMREEFDVYGLPPSFMFAVGAVKISLISLPQLPQAPLLPSGVRIRGISFQVHDVHDVVHED